MNNDKDMASVQFAWSRGLLDTVTDHVFGGYTRLRNQYFADELDDDGLPLSEKNPEPMTKLTKLKWALLPSFVSRRFGQCDVEPPTPNETSYLNGLRGIAAMVVVFQHMCDDWSYWIHMAYLSGPNETHPSQFPFLRDLLAGRFMVAIFYVLSGFVLAYGPLKKAHAGDPVAAIAGLPTAVVRRPIRLFLPVLPVAFVSAILVWMQVFWHGFDTKLVYSSGLFGDLWQAWHQWWNLSWKPLQWEEYMPAWFGQCHTLGTEFRGSMVIYVMILALARVPPWLRMSISAFCAWDAMVNYPDRWSVFLFLVGFMLADLRHLRPKFPEVSRDWQSAGKLVARFFLGAGLFFGGWGEGAEKGMWFQNFADWPTYGHMHDVWWMAWGAVMLVTSLEFLPDLQAWFNHPFILYLGEISYGVYLVHYAVIQVLAKGLILAMQARGVSFPTSWNIGSGIALMVVVWVGDIHWRLVDRKSVTFARWVVDKMGVKA
jgi:peptidoglycan/LPS O-acetylase OafA/YrhL